MELGMRRVANIGIYFKNSVDDIHDKEELEELFMELDCKLYDYKWRLAKLWLFGNPDHEMSPEDNLAVAGLI